MKNIIITVFLIIIGAMQFHLLYCQCRLRDLLSKHGIKRFARLLISTSIRNDMKLAKNLITELHDKQEIEELVAARTTVNNVLISGIVTFFGLGLPIVIFIKFTLE